MGVFLRGGKAAILFLGFLLISCTQNFLKLPTKNNSSITSSSSGDSTSITPVFTWNTVPDSNFWHNTSKVFTYTISPATGITNIVCKVNGLSVTTGCTGSQFTVTQEGVSNVVIEVTHQSGQVATSSAKVVKIDTVRPITTLITQSANAQNTIYNFTIHSTNAGEQLSYYNYSLDGVAQCQNPGDCLCPDTGVCTFSVTTTPGPHGISVNVIDHAGNTLLQPLTYSWLTIGKITYNAKTNGGAICDGKADDTLKIQKLIDDTALLNAASGMEAIVLIPDSVKCVVTYLHLPSNSKLQVDGTLFLKDQSNGPLLDLTGYSASGSIFNSDGSPIRTSNFRITGHGIIDGNRKTNSSLPGQGNEFIDPSQHPNDPHRSTRGGLGGIGGLFNDNITIQGDSHDAPLTITNIYHWPVNLVASNTIRLKHLKFLNSGAASECAGFKWGNTIHYTTDCQVDDLTAVANDDNCWAFYGGVNGGSIKNSDLKNCPIGITVVSDTPQPGPNSNITIENNKVYGNYNGYGITVVSDHIDHLNVKQSNIKILNNDVYQNEAGGIAVFNADSTSGNGIEITGNRIHHNKNNPQAFWAYHFGAGIVVGSNNVTVKGNTIWDEGTNQVRGLGIQFSPFNYPPYASSFTGQNVIVQDNIISDNTTSDPLTRTMEFGLRLQTGYNNPQIFNNTVTNITSCGAGRTLVNGICVNAPVVGVYDGILSGQNFIGGWACAQNSPFSINVALYVDDGTPPLKGIGWFMATFDSEQAVASSCISNGTKYRFRIDLGDPRLNPYRGQNLSVHLFGISPFDGTPGTIINSGRTNPDLNADGSIRARFTIP
ncbi:MAG: right-handed parallel beta-helix repeat-containing protein [Oligoflexia bacterium]|nr:right-handed parallel beta-helix repeat-containing protein [Oligoflexia bacterium]